MLQPAFLALWTCPRAAAGSEEHLSEALGPEDARQREISSSMASGGAPIRVDIGVKNALQTLLQHHLLLGGELSDRETSGRAAVTVPCRTPRISAPALVCTRS